MPDGSACYTDLMNLPLEVKTGGELGTFEGYGAIFGNTDRDGDIIKPGAFKTSLAGRIPALLWQHDAKEPIGRFDVVREDAKGLYVKGRLAMTGRGLEAYALLKMGALDGLSIGFVTREATRDAARGVRTITQAELMEISLVTFPANDLARVSAVKAAPDDVRAFERLLRDSGYSRARAKAITAQGFKAQGFREAAPADDVIEDVVQLVKTRTARLEQKGMRPIILAPGADSEWFVMDIHVGGTYGLMVVATLDAAAGYLATTDDLAVGAIWFQPRGNASYQQTQVNAPVPYRNARFSVGTPTSERPATQPLLRFRLKNTSSRAGRFMVYNVR